jgi:putative serine protease PepD
MPDPPADPMGDASDCATPSTLEDPQTLTGVTLPGTLYAHYAVTGLPDGTPFTIELRNPEGEPLGSLDGQWTLGSGEVCAVVGLDVPEGLAGANAVLVIGGTEIQNPVLFQ